jgi:hypothetical protein
VPADLPIRALDGKHDNQAWALRRAAAFEFLKSGAGKSGDPYQNGDRGLNYLYFLVKTLKSFVVVLLTHGHLFEDALYAV